VSGICVRRLEPGEELGSALHLVALAFGWPRAGGEPPPRPSQLPAGRIWYGAFDAAGRLIGTAADLCHEQWWGGRQVSAADMAAIAVLPEARGGGTARTMLKALLEGAYERGAAVSALYPTTAAVYRTSGWAVCGQLRSVDLPTALLSAVRSTSGGTLTVRAADPTGADQPAVADLYTRLARSREGLLTRRRTPSPAAVGWPNGIDGMTLVEDGGTLVGYASWVRGTGYGSDAVLDVPDLLAATSDAARELIGVLAGWRSVTPTVRVRPLAFDASSMLLPWESGIRFDAKPWMHRPVEVTRALTGRGWPVNRRGRVAFHLHDPIAQWNDGGWQFEVDAGEAALVRTPTAPDLRLHVAGFALLYCGVATPEMLLETGLLHGPADGISGLEVLRPTSPAQLLDYF
jgi:predicted acetyltransferase